MDLLDSDARYRPLFGDRGALAYCRVDAADNDSLTG